MCNPVLIGLAFQVGGMVVGGMQQQDIGDANAQILRRQAADRRLIGEQEEQDQRRKTAALIGHQAAAFGASGAVIGEGSSLEVLGDTREFGELDALRVRDNANREAIAFENAAEISEAGGNAALTSGLFSAAGAVAGKWGSFGNPFSTAGGPPVSTSSKGSPIGAGFPKGKKFDPNPGPIF